MTDPLYLIAYVLLGAVAGMIYSLRRIFKLEQAILDMEARIIRAIGTRRGGVAKSRASKRRKKAAKKKAKKRRKR